MSDLPPPIATSSSPYIDDMYMEICMCQCQGPACEWHLGHFYTPPQSAVESFINSSAPEQGANYPNYPHAPPSTPITSQPNDQSLQFWSSRPIKFLPPELITKFLRDDDFIPFPSSGPSPTVESQVQSQVCNETEGAKLHGEITANDLGCFLDSAVILDRHGNEVQFEA
ncbi:hypothetical protein BYT27DRAFT_7242449 [Phlegmacium glaucopus]|nr:hypothetical protein BYT27DRAFT_7242449 [Phlegmacium glaucopus]